MPPPDWIIVTARNEAHGLAATLTALREAFPHAELLLADDASRDATPAIAAAHGAQVVSAPRPLGKGGAATLAARWLLARSGDLESAGHAGGQRPDAIALLCDADLGASAARLGALVDAVAGDECDLAVAAFTSRAGGGLGIAVGFARWAIRRRCGLDLGAPISGQRALRHGTLELAVPFAAGYGMEIGMTIDLARAGQRVREVPLDLRHRASGRTPRGFGHRGRQLLDFVRVYAARR